jgi:hypothetical protein
MEDPMTVESLAKELATLRQEFEALKQQIEQQHAAEEAERQDLLDRMT